MTREELYKKIDATPILEDPDELDLELIAAMEENERRKRMKPLKLRLPLTLREKLEKEAELEGVSLDQY